MNVESLRYGDIRGYHGLQALLRAKEAGSIEKELDKAVDTLGVEIGPADGSERNRAIAGAAQRATDIIFPNGGATATTKHIIQRAYGFGVLLSRRLVPDAEWGISEDTIVHLKQDYIERFNYIWDDTQDYLDRRHDIGTIVNHYLPAVCPPIEHQDWAARVVALALMQVEDYRLGQLEEQEITAFRQAIETWGMPS